MSAKDLPKAVKCQREDRGFAVEFQDGHRMFEDSGEVSLSLNGKEVYHVSKFLSEHKSEKEDAVALYAQGYDLARVTSYRESASQAILNKYRNELQARSEGGPY